MRRADLALAGLLATLLAAPAAGRAQNVAEPAAGSAEAARLIEATGAGELFDNITDGKVAEVRHRRSGLKCSFEPDEPGNRLMVFDAPYAEPGDDVGCTTLLHTEEPILVTLYATRFRERFPEKAIFDDAVLAIRQRYPDAKLFEGPVAHVSVEPKRGAPRPPKVRTARIEATDEGQPIYTEVSLATVGEWTFKIRITAPKARSMEAAMAAGVLLIAAMEDASPATR
jgi:hypothetical protein